MTKSTNLALSIFSFVFIAALVSISYLKYEISNQVLRGILELVTIPIILMTIVLLVTNVMKWSKEKWSFKTSTCYSLIALILSITTMIIATITNM